MNVGKTELHLMRGPAHAEIRSGHGSKISTRGQSGNPHSVYKYLGVYFYTSEYADRTLAFIESGIYSFYAHLARLVGCAVLGRGAEPPQFWVFVNMVGTRNFTCYMGAL